MEFSEWIAKAVELLKAAGVDDVTTWVAVCATIAAQHKWTLDEASTNLANLLTNLAAEA
jgi:hypothetical protein